MAKVDEIIIEVEVNAGESAEKLADVRAKIADLKAENKSYRQEAAALNQVMKQTGTLSEDQAKRLNEITEAEAKNTATLKQLTAEEKMYTNQIALATQGDRKFGDSITELGAQLAQLKAEYRALSKEQRESAEGKAMLAQIQNLDSEVKKLDASLGDHQRNVGNYQSALLGLNGNVLKAAQLFQGGFRNGLTAAGQSLKAFTKTMLATPIGQISTALRILVNVFRMLKDAFKANDDAGTSLSSSLAKLSPIVTAIKEGFVALTATIAKVVGWMTNAATTIIGKLVPSYKEAAEAQSELVKSQDALEDSQREHTINEAKRAKEIAALRKQAVSDEKLTAKEREAIYKQIDELSRQNMEEQKRIAEENYRILQQRAKEEADTSDEMKNRLADAYAAMLKAQTDYLTETTRIGSREAQARKEQAAQEQKELEDRRRRWDEYQKAKVEAAKKANDELRKLEDLQNEFISDVSERTKKQIEIQYKREIEDLRARLKTEKDLTEEARESINKQILLLNSKMQKELMDYDAEELRKRNEVTMAERRKLEDAQTALIKDDIERRQKAAKAAAEREIQDIRDRLNTDTTLTIEQREILGKQIKAREEKLQQELDEIHEEAIKRRYEEDALKIANEYQRKLNDLFGNATEQAKLEAEQAAQFYKSLAGMSEENWQAMFDNEEAYKSAVLSAEREMYEAREKSAQAQATQAKEVGATMQAVTGALSSLFEAAAGDSEEYEKFKKAMAIVDATISLATTIASATASSTAGDPYTMAIRIATNVAAVTAQFAAVIAAIKSATVPSAPAFAQGGIVPGNSYTGDRITAAVNSREMVLTLQQQGRLFDMIQAGVPQVGIDYSRLSQAVAEGVSALPAPVLEYSEFTAFARRVSMVERKLNEM